MRPGLYICSVPSGGYYPYTIIGWFRSVEGDEWECVGSRVLRRYGSGQALAGLAANGPAADTELLVASAYPVPLHRLNLGRPERCDPTKWAALVPRPMDWAGDD